MAGAVQLGCNAQSEAPKNSAAQTLNLLCRPLSVALAKRETDAVKEVASENPLEKINVFAAVLAVALAVLTLVAQKAASEARHEADQAAMRVSESERRVYLQNALALFSLEAQRIKNQEVLNLEKYESFESINPQLADLYMRWAELLNELNNLLVGMLHSVEEDGVSDLSGSCGLVEAFVKDLDKAHRDYVTLDSIELLRDQSRLFVAPLRKLLKRTVDILGEVELDGIAADNLPELAMAMRRLNGILRELG